MDESTKAFLNVFKYKIEWIKLIRSTSYNAETDEYGIGLVNAKTSVDYLSNLIGSTVRIEPSAVFILIRASIDLAKNLQSGKWTIVDNDIVQVTPVSADELRNLGIEFSGQNVQFFRKKYISIIADYGL